LSLKRKPWRNNMRHDFTGIESNFAPKWPQHSQLTLAFLISPPLMAGLYGTRGKNRHLIFSQGLFLKVRATKHSLFSID
ncbi:hypothetical protein, partial [Parasutterella secunda]|uniref:hypothetical protein n=1 Tax=Parasutterella secunda TaxID=626947 RepID=UPI0025A3745F